MQPHDNILLAIVWAADINVALRKARVTKPLRHRFRCRTHIAHRICGIDLDQLFEDVVRKLPSGVVQLCIQIRNKQYCAQQQIETVQVPPLKRFEFWSEKSNIVRQAPCAGMARFEESDSRKSNPTAIQESLYFDHLTRCCILKGY